MWVKCTRCGEVTEVCRCPVTNDPFKRIQSLETALAEAERVLIRVDGLVDKFKNKPVAAALIGLLTISETARAYFKRKEERNG
jgi:hypothetical protein